MGSLTLPPGFTASSSAPQSPPLQSVTTQEESFWDRYWTDPALTPHDYFALITRDDLHNLREKASGNLTALCFKVGWRKGKYRQQEGGRDSIVEWCSEFAGGGGFVGRS